MIKGFFWLYTYTINIEDKLISAFQIEIFWIYRVDFEKRGGCGVVARKRHESHMSQ